MTEPLPPTLLAHPDTMLLDLQPDEPLTVVAGTPLAYVAELYRDRRVQCGVWEVSPGTVRKVYVIWDVAGMS
jgi:uncharacterized cupin superfamily protein